MTVGGNTALHIFLPAQIAKLDMRPVPLLDVPIVISCCLADFASNMRLDGLKNAEAALLKTGLISKKIDVEAFCYPGSL